MQTAKGMPDMVWLRQERLVRRALIGGSNWIQGKLPNHAIDYNITCEKGRYELHVSVELLDADLMEHFDRQREATKAECGSVGNIRLKAVI